MAGFICLMFGYLSWYLLGTYFCSNLQADAIYPFIIPLQVYVTKDGKELAGRSGYRQYRKVHLKTSYINDDFFFLFFFPLLFKGGTSKNLLY
jgi:hypothetical protein